MGEAKSDGPGRARLEWFEGGAIDLDAWMELLDARLSDEEQDDQEKVWAAWAEFLKGLAGREYADRQPRKPTRTMPGTPEHEEALRGRIARRERLLHPDDAYPRALRALWEELG
jgi:hypothetical protein